MTTDEAPGSGRARLGPYALGALGVAGVLALWLYPFLLRAYLVQAFKIPSGAMMPTLLIGDHLLADKTVGPEEVRRGDIIVFRFPPDRRKHFIKRVVAVAGDRIQIVRKDVRVNGVHLPEPHAAHAEPGYQPDRDDYGPAVVPERCWFVLGDNRDRSFDSRFWGFVGFGDFVGRAVRLYWSWDADAGGVRWERIGLRLR